MTDKKLDDLVRRLAHGMVSESTAVDSRNAITVLRAEVAALKTALEAIEMESRIGAQWTFAEINECARVALKEGK